MIRIDSNSVQLMGVTERLLAEFSHGVYDLIKAQAEAEEKPVLKLAPIMLAEITGAVFHAAEEEKKNAAE